MKIKFTERRQEGLHCRFCKCGPSYMLYETSPITGIVCKYCKEHLENYTLAQAKCSCSSKIEETIKRIEERQNHIKSVYPDVESTLCYFELELALQIIKEQFPIISKRCELQQEDTK